MHLPKKIDSELLTLAGIFIYFGLTVLGFGVYFPLADFLFIAPLLFVSRNLTALLGLLMIGFGLLLVWVALQKRESS